MGKGGYLWVYVGGSRYDQAVEIKIGGKGREV